MIPVDRIPVDALRELVRLIVSGTAERARSCDGARAMLLGLTRVLRCCRIVYGVSDAVAPSAAPAWSSVLDVCPGEMQPPANTHWISVHQPHTDAQRRLFESLCRKPLVGEENDGPALRVPPNGNGRTPLNARSIVRPISARSAAITTKACGYSLGACRARREPPFEGWELTILRLFHAELGERHISATDTNIPGPLPPRLRRVLPLLLRGLKINEIADNLRLSPYTVREYIQDIYSHFGIHQRHELNAIHFSEPSQLPPGLP